MASNKKWDQKAPLRQCTVVVIDQGATHVNKIELNKYITQIRLLVFKNKYDVTLCVDGINWLICSLAVDMLQMYSYIRTVCQ